MPLLAAMQLSMHLSRASSPLPKKSVDPWWTVSEKCKMEDNHIHHICEEVSKIQPEQPGKFDDPPDNSGHGPVRASFRDLAQNCRVSNTGNRKMRDMRRELKKPAAMRLTGRIAS